MPTVLAYHDVTDVDHWLASPKREEFFGPLGITNIRTFVDPQAMKPAQYPFMLTGPVSPLSFTGAPVFLSVFTSFGEFELANAHA